MVPENEITTDAHGALAWMRRAMAASGDVAYEWDIKQGLIRWDGPVLGLFCVSDLAKVATGESFHSRIHPEDLPRRFRALTRHFRNRDPFDCEYRVRDEDGEHRWIHDRGEAEFSKNGEMIRLIGTMRLIAVRKRHRPHHEEQTGYDELTGHFNRSRLREELDRFMAGAVRYKIPGALLVIGIDRLAAINEAEGYETGDAILIEVGQRIDRCVRGSDVVGHLGGDRFGVILGNCPEDDISAVADKVMGMVSQNPIHTPGGPRDITVSAGGLSFPGFARTARDALTKAEIALREAKRKAPNRFFLSRLTEIQRHDRRRNLALADRVRKALEEDRLVFAYQPVIDARNGRVSHYECLMRLLQSDGTVVSAGAFMPIVEEVGIIHLIDRRALELAIADLIRFPQVTLALNVSGLTTTDRAWLRALIAHLKGQPELARRLVVEITETAVLEDVAESAQFVSTLQDLGCSVALDDFGTGHISFHHLRVLNVDVQKIDGSFVHGIAHNPQNRLFIRSLVGLAEGLGLTTVAEGVEKEEDAKVLIEDGIHYLQGFLYGRPSIERPWRNGREKGARRTLLRRRKSGPPPTDDKIKELARLQASAK
jgi:diguanylate cyclase (GGDEF)-like protein